MSAHPRLGFLGTGWIGCARMQAIADDGCAEIAAIADPSHDRRREALRIAPGAMACQSLAQLLDVPLDGVVIATPSALHADQAIAAIARGRAVFCQKPLARDGNEAHRVVMAAHAQDRLLGVDMSYRHTAAVRAIRDALAAGRIGRVFALDLVFHNAYGPEAAWFYDRASAGGGCVMDLGVHLVDLAYWLLGYPALEAAESALFANGVPLELPLAKCEDFAEVQLRFAGGVVARLACSWRVSAGHEAVIGATIYGTEGALAMRNVHGSFYDFIAEHHIGTRSEPLAAPPDAWGGRAAVAWARKLAESRGFDPEIERCIDVARIVDAIYAGARA